MKLNTIVRAAILMTALAGLMIGLMPVSAQNSNRSGQPPESQPGATDRDYLRDVADETGSVNVLVGLNVEPVGRMAFDTLSASAQESIIAQTADSLLAELNLTRSTPNVRRYDNLPMLALSVTSDQLDILDTSGLVTYIQENRWRQVSLDVATANIGMTGANGAWNKCSDEADTKCANGAGQHIVILDSGIMSTHDFLVGKVVAEACFSSNANPTGYTVTSLCPAGATSSYAIGSAQPCSVYGGECEHGTHIAGIAAGKGMGAITFNGVAKEANLISIQVFSKIVDDTDPATKPVCERVNYPMNPSTGRYECILAADGDIIAAMNYIYTTLRNTYTIAAVNMSFGNESYPNQDECEARLPGYRAPLNNLLNAGIAVVASAGNQGSSISINGPACLRGMISVGATCDAAYDLPHDGNLDGNFDCVTNSLTPFTNAVPFMTLLAPGAKITSSASGGSTNYFAEKSGTSQAAAFVSGAIAAMRSYRPGTTQAQIRQALTDTAVYVDDVATVGTIENYPKINVNLAVDALISPDQPMLLSPAVNAAFAASPIEFVWTAGDYTTEYTLQIRSLSGNNLTTATVLHENCAPDELNFPGEGPVCKAQIAYAFKDETVYNWRVRAKYAVNNSTVNSDLRPFQYDTPGRTTLISPANKATINDPSELTEFTWQEVALATSYRVTLYDRANGAVRIKSPQLPSSVCVSQVCSYIPTPTDLAKLANAKNYGWYVTSINADGTSKSAEHRLKTQFPAAPLLQSPADGFTFTSLNSIQLSWTDIVAASSYRIKITDTTTNTVVANQLLTNVDVCLSGTCTYVPTPAHLAKFVSKRTYRWTVTSINALGKSTSAPLTFKTQFPAPPVLIAPLTGALFENPALTFEFSQISDANTYVLLIKLKNNGVQVLKRKLTPGVDLSCDGTKCTYALDASDQAKLKNGKVHTWVVRSVNSAGKGKSEVREFTLQSPQSAVLQTPGENIVFNAPEAVSFSWLDVGAGADYSVRIKDRVSGKLIVSAHVSGLSCVSGQCSYALSAEEQGKLKRNREYRWWIVATNAVGKSKSAKLSFFTNFP